MKEVQSYLKSTGRYPGKIDGLWGPMTRLGIIKGFEDGPDTPLSAQDFIDSARRIDVPMAHIRAMADVEAAGAGFYQGMPKILPEPHRFSKNTNRRFDQSHPYLSYRSWGTRPYPRTQAARYDMLLDMIRLSPMEGFASASYGKFQILGENFKSCRYESPMEFAFAMGVDEKTQLMAFEAFIVANGIQPALKTGDWKTVARKYNGPAYAKNQYDVKLARAAAKYK